MQNDGREKIRIAFFADMLIADYDGAVRTMYQLLNRIDHNRFEFLFVCGEGPAEVNGFPCLHVPSFTLPINRNYRMALPFLAKKKLHDSLEAFAPQVVHIATPSFLGQFALKYAGQQQLPVLSIYHTHFVSYIEYYFSATPFLINPVKSKLVETQNGFYNQCSLIYMPSQSIARELAASGVQEHRMKLWQRGIDTHLFSPEKRSPEVVHRLTGNTRKNILFASRLVWEKNLETLFRIYDLLQQQNEPYNLLVVGDGVAREACEKHMPEAIFTGKLNHEKLSQLYASADVFLFPSISEAYGNVVLEAMASGLPCVIGNGGGSRDFIRQGENGFTCEPYNERDYVEKLKRVLENPPLAAQFIELGLQYSQQLDWNTLAATYFDDLGRLARNTASAHPLIPVYS
jgi:glycosyltransferase involved in cell wall biosynthesis